MMKNLLFLLSCLLLCVPCFAAVTASNVQSDYSDTDDFSPFLFFLVMATLFVCCIGLALVLLLLAVFLALVAFGIVSASVIVGLTQKSVSKGFNTFILLTATIGGSMFGGLAFWIVNKISHWFDTATSVYIGITSGFISGLVVGTCACYLLAKALQFLSRRWSKKDALT